MNRPRSNYVWQLRPIALAATLAIPGMAFAQDPATLSIEQLVNVEVYSASKFNQKAADAPASVTVVGREDIRSHGYRTLAEVIQSVRGMYVYTDRNYEYVGVRGFARPGDYNSRVLLLIDGYRTNENVFDSIFIGHDAILDIDLIERVEFVRGPSSSLYGGNAFFGVINIVTRDAKDLPTAELAASTGRFRTHDGRVTLAHNFENGAGLVLSASKLRSAGQNLYYPDVDTADKNFGRAENVEHTANERQYSKFTYAGFALTGAFATRLKGQGYGVYGADFNDKASVGRDTTSFLDAAFSRALTSKLDLDMRLSYGDYRYHYEGNFSGVLNRFINQGRWWAGEAKVLYGFSSRHRVVAGIEYQRNGVQDQINLEVGKEPYFDDRRKSFRYGIYAQDEYTWSEAFTTSLGVRHDRLTVGETVTSPRVAGIYRLSSATTLKALYGSAFRAPNVYELYSKYEDNAIANPNLRSEQISSVDLVAEHYMNKNTRAVLNAYRFKTKQLINQVNESTTGLLQFQNTTTVTARGLELELEYIASGGTRLRGSAAVQQNEDDGGTIITNSPKQLHKASIAMPLGVARMRLGLDWHYIGPRTTSFGPVGGSHVTNVNLLADAGKRGLEWSFGVYNLFDRRYDSPVLREPQTLPERDRIVQEPRTWRFKLVYRF